MLKQTQLPREVEFPPDFGRNVVRNEYHVISNMRFGWSVNKYGARRSYRSFDTKAEALRCARAIARKHRADLVIHRENASVERVCSFAPVPGLLRYRAG